MAATTLASPPTIVGGLGMREGPVIDRVPEGLRGCGHAVMARGCAGGPTNSGVGRERLRQLAHGGPCALADGRAEDDQARDECGDLGHVEGDRRRNLVRVEGHAAASAPARGQGHAAESKPFHIAGDRPCGHHELAGELRQLHPPAVRGVQPFDENLLAFDPA